MNTYIYRLSFLGPVHFGSSGIGMENTQLSLSSDSITSALINAFAIMGKAEEVVDALNSKTPPFVLSSLFPFGPIQDSPIAYAVPRPLSLPFVKNEEDIRLYGKDLKRLRFLKSSDLSLWLGDKPLDKTELKGIIERGHQLATPWDNTYEKGWFASVLRPRVSLDRVTQTSNIWQCGILHFQKDAGLYGLIHIVDNKWFKDIEMALRLLGDVGIGGERTYGLGLFTFSGFESPDPEQWGNYKIADPSKFILASRYFPSKEEHKQLTEFLVAWNFQEIRGYITSGRDATTLKRKRVRMITEGSVVSKPVIGSLANVTPCDADSFGLKHKIYRCGLAFLLPLGVNV